MSDRLPNAYSPTTFHRALPLNTNIVSYSNHGKAVLSLPLLQLTVKYGGSRLYRHQLQRQQL